MRIKITLQALIRALREAFPYEEIRIADSKQQDIVWITITVNRATYATMYDFLTQEAYNMSDRIFGLFAPYLPHSVTGD